MSVVPDPPRDLRAGFVQVDALTVDYGAAPVVDAISFAVDAGEHVTLLGPSGCGKTTLIRAIAGLAGPRAGRIMIDGSPVFDSSGHINVPPEQRGLAMVFQSYAIWPHMSVYDNVAFPFRVRGQSHQAARPKVESALALVGLQAMQQRPATQLSGGQQQRVALARAIACQSKVVLFDEPLSNLDAQLRVSMRAELGDLHRRLGLTTIYVTHDQEEAYALSDRIVVMNAGRIVQQGSPRDIHATPCSRFVAQFLGCSNILNANLLPTAVGWCDALLDGGLVLRCRDPRGGGAQHGAVCFRPIDLQIVAAAPSATGNPGILGSIQFLGDMTQYRVTAGAMQLVGLDRARAGLSDGQPILWSVDPAHLLALRE